MKFKYIIIIVLMILSFAFSACSKGGDDMYLTDKEAGGTIKYDYSNTMDKDYVYMWSSFLNKSQKNIYFQSPSYQMIIDGANAQLLGLNTLNYEDREFVRQDFTNVNGLSMSYNLSYDGKLYDETVVNYAYTGFNSRIIESGRYIQHIDFPKIAFQGIESVTGRLGVVAQQSFVTFAYELFTASAMQNVGLELSLSVQGYTLESSGENSIVIRANNGNGLAIAWDSSFNNLNCSFIDGKVKFSYTCDVEPNAMTGFSFSIKPLASSEKVTNEYFSMSGISIEANQISPSVADQDVYFDAKTNQWVVSANNTLGAIDFKQEENRTKYDRIVFTVTNDNDSEISVPISFRKDSAISITGVSPMLRDAETLNPIGTQVQISKNWHAINEPIPGDSLATFAKQWLRASTVITVPAHDSVTLEYTCAYGQWGETYASSHAQLSLVGYSGGQLWDQAALGSWGESITYDPMINLGRSFIDDVRVFLTNDGGGEYAWTDNVGGADFLDYSSINEDGILQRNWIDQVIVSYKSQAPNMSDVIYSGISEDGKIAIEINARMGRTNDIVRSTYSIKLNFLEDVNFNNLAIFKLCADGYADNYFTSYAIGNDQSSKPAVPVSAMPEMEKSAEFEGANPWFMLMDSLGREEYANIGFIVRDYSAKLNGKTYNVPAYKLVRPSDDTTQVACELTVNPQVGNKIKKGSTIETVIEYLILPTSVSQEEGQLGYYGDSEYLTTDRGGISVIGSVDAMVEQAMFNDYKITIEKGTLIRKYPIEINIDESGDKVVAQFSMRRGLGYTPIVFNGLDSYDGYYLEYGNGTHWKALDQSVQGNDFWQVRYDYETQKYQIVYNVHNAIGINRDTQLSYRLVKK